MYPYELPATLPPALLLCKNLLRWVREIRLNHRQNAVAVDAPDGVEDTVDGGDTQAASRGGHRRFSSPAVAGARYLIWSFAAADQQQASGSQPSEPHHASDQ